MADNIEVSATNHGEQLIPLNNNFDTPQIQKMSVANEESQKLTPKVYKIRWIILYLFCLSSASSIMQWTQYSVIANVVVDFYDVSYEAVDWSSMVYLLTYVIFIFPGMYLLDKMGLRICIILAMLGTSIGAWIKVTSVSPDRFWTIILGQSLVASSQVFMLSFPALLANNWFGPNEVSMACSIGVIGIQLGMALGFLIPPMIVTEEGNHEKQFYIMSIGVALINTLMLILLIIFFKDKPPTPPSVTFLESKKENSLNVNEFFNLLKRLFTNLPYVTFLNSYGINVGIFYTISTLLNQILLKHYPDAAEDVGRIGLTIILTGMAGSFTSGLVLDKFGYFKKTAIIFHVSCLLIMIAFTITLEKGITIVYIVTALFGFVMTGLYPLGLEIAAEITYPEPEGTTTGLAVTFCQVYGIAFIYLYSYLFYNVDEFWANIFMCILFLISAILIVLMPFNLKRQRAQKRPMNNI